MVLVLLRSIRRAERVCQRDFILMLGAHVQIPFDERGVLEREGVRFVTVRPLMPGVPTADKLEVWRLITNFFFFGALGIDFLFHMFFLARCTLHTSCECVRSEHSLC